MGDEKDEKPGSKSAIAGLKELIIVIDQGMKEIKENLRKRERSKMGREKSTELSYFNRGR